MKEERKFEGVWIPAEVWLNPSLSISEKCLLVEINSLDNSEEKGCFASNDFLAKFLGLSESRLANMLTDLKKRGHIQQVFFDGRQRGLAVNPETLGKIARRWESSIPKNGKAPFPKMGIPTSQKRESTVPENGNIDNQLDYQLDNQFIDTETLVSERPTQQTAQEFLIETFEGMGATFVDVTPNASKPKNQIDSNGGGAKNYWSETLDEFSKPGTDDEHSEMARKMESEANEWKEKADGLAKRAAAKKLDGFTGREKPKPQPHPENEEIWQHFSNPQAARELWVKWLTYKQAQFGARERYKTPESEHLKLRDLFIWSDRGNVEKATAIIEKSIGNLYKGFFDPKEKSNGSPNYQSKPTADQQFATRAARYAAEEFVDYSKI